MTSRIYNIKDHTKDTCNWFTNHDNYRKWQNNPSSSAFWLMGKPGSGKSTVMKHAVQQCLEREGDGKVVVASFFIDGRGTDLNKTTKGLFRSLIHQLIEKIPSVRAEVAKFYGNKVQTLGPQGGKWEWQPGEVRQWLRKVIDEFATAYTIYIYIDALDEAVDARKEQIDTLFHDLCSGTSGSESKSKSGSELKLCVSCRHFPSFDRGKAQYLVTEQENSADIRKYIALSLQNFSRQDRPTIEDKLTEKASGMFQWVALVAPEVKRLNSAGHSTRKILATIDQYPQELNDVYERILSQIDTGDKPLSLRLFQWVFYTATPLSLKELQWAIAINVDHPAMTLEDIKESDDFIGEKQVERRIKSLSGGMVSIIEEENQSKEKDLGEVSSSKSGSSDEDVHNLSRRVRLIHQSTGDYLVERGFTFLSSAENFNPSVAGHFLLSRACAIYVSTLDISEAVRQYYYCEFPVEPDELAILDRRMNPGSEVKEELFSAYDFLDYSSWFWVQHSQFLEQEGYDQQDLPGLVARSKTEQQPWRRVIILNRVYPSKNLLHLSAKHGLISIVEHLLQHTEKSWHSTRDRYDGTALHSAAESDSITTVQSLLVHGVGVDLRNRNGSSALHIAAEFGNAEILSLLLEKSSEGPNQRDKWGRTPLHNAKNAATVDVLLHHSANINALDIDDNTPLHFAVSWRGFEVVNHLINRSADVFKRDRPGYTALHHAAHRATPQVIELLLKFINVNDQAKTGSTPLHVAAYWGRTKATEILLEHSARTDLRDNQQRTILHAAALGTKPELMEILLRREVELNAQDEDGYTPLHYTVKNPWVNLCADVCTSHCNSLIKSGANVNATNSYGECALHLACKLDGGSQLVEILLRKGAIVDLADERGNTPALCARDWETLQTLINGNADLSVKNTSRASVIHSSSCGSAEMLSQLIQLDAAFVHHVDNHDRTALHYAASRNSANLTVLIDAGADVDAIEKDERTPLFYALDRGINMEPYLPFPEIALIFFYLDVLGLEGQSMEPDGKMLLESVFTLIEKGASVNHIDSKGQTPLHLAAKLDTLDPTEVVNKLFSASAQINVVDHDGCTALHYALQYGNQSTIITLIKSGANVSAADKQGRTALHYALKYQTKSIIVALLKSGVDVDAIDNKEISALDYANEHRSLHVVCLLLLFEAWSNGHCLGHFRSRHYHCAAQRYDQPDLEVLAERLLKIEASLDDINIDAEEDDEAERLMKIEASLDDTDSDVEEDDDSDGRNSQEKMQEEVRFLLAMEGVGRDRWISSAGDLILLGSTSQVSPEQPRWSRRHTFRL